VSRFPDGWLWRNRLKRLITPDNRFTIGTPAASGRKETMRREKVYEVVWSTTLPALLKQWHVEEKGLKSALRRYGIPVPPPAAWKSVRALRVASRPHLPRASLRAPNEVTVWLRR
jgi:hypothetical protein